MPTAYIRAVMGFATNPIYVLWCGPHNIPIPRPSQAGITANPPGTATAEKQAVVACPECGRVSVHLESSVQVMLSPKPDPFVAEECLLVSINVECDGEGCEAPKVVHTVIGTDRGTWKQKVAPTQWR